jgi:hypothetical protein
MHGVDPHRLVFLDEASVETGMTRHFARCAKGKRAVERVNTKSKKRVTLLGAMSLGGFEALSMLKGSVTGKRFSDWMVDALLAKAGKRRCGGVGQRVDAQRQAMATAIPASRR